MITYCTQSFQYCWKLLCFALIGDLLIVRGAERWDKSQACMLQSEHLPKSYSRDGDIIIGGILQINLVATGEKENFREVPYPIICVGTSFWYLQHLLAFIYAIEEINDSADILPNITLGFQIYDACNSEVLALISTLSLISEKEQPIPNVICQKQQRTVGLIGHISSSPSYTMSQITQLYGYSQISYGAMNPDFNDRVHFPYIYRTVPDDSSQIKVIIQLLIHFGWTWVGIIASNDDSNQHASEELKKELKKIGICVAFLAVISHKPDNNEASIRKVAEVIQNSSVNVIISFCSSSAFIGLLEGRLCRVTSRKLWIASMALNIITDERFQNYLHAFNGSLLISVHKGEIKGFKNFLYRPTWYNIPDIIFLEDIWNFNFECTNILPNDIPKKHCSKEEKWNESLTQVESNTCHFTHAIYIAVYALAQALHDMHLSTRILDQFAEKTAAKIRLKLNNYLQNGHFKIASGQEFSFNEEGYISGRFYIQNWVIYTNGTIEKYYIGSFSSINQKFYINESAIIWGPHFNQTPTSVCTETCPSGFRKAPQIGKPACCFDCIPCSEGEITNSTDMENCVKCPEDQWSNPKRDQCIKRSIDFLSYDHLLGTALSCFASIFLLITSGVLWILIKYGSTPIVKVNNQKLSFILLLSLMGSYTCSFLFIGQPMELTCLLRHVTIGFFFTVAISSVLGKTVTVVIAFNATKPGSKLKKWVGSGMSVGLVLVCSLGEIVICITWLICSPPFVDTDTKSTLGTIIVQCNEGSTIAFYLAVSYIAVLALFSFSVAFIVRKLPDSFNESKYITFSMLVFCSVWVTFVPTYLSTKGKIYGGC